MVRGKIFIEVVRAHFTKKIRLLNQSATDALNALNGGKQQKTIKALDGVRAIACLSVMSFHLNLFSFYGHVWSPYLDTIGALFSSVTLLGETGVMLFFILSGFLLFLPFAKAMLLDQPWPSLRRYYVRRVFRILPAYYVALLLITLYLHPEYFQPAHLHDFWLFLTFRMDFPITYQQLNAPFWTLAIEFQFYLLLPLIAGLMCKCVRWGSVSLRLMKIVLCLLVLMAWGLFTRYWGFIMTSPNVNEPLLPNNIVTIIKPYIFGTSGKYFEVFALGMLSAVAYILLQNISDSSRLKSRLRRLSPFLFVFGLIILNVVDVWHYYVVYMHGKSLHFLDPYQNFLVDFKDVLNPFGFALGYGCCLFAILHGPNALKRPFEWAPLCWIGCISYSLYIWHDPFVLFFLYTFLPKFQQLGWSQPVQYVVYAAWIVITTFPLSLTFYRWVEMPGIRLGEKVCSLIEGQSRKIEQGRVAFPPLEEKVLVASGRGNNALPIREEQSSRSTRKKHA
jgi:peptidoglycan/LPS O-acetylase OafA/YrhL